jgi:hypothetical protein
MKTPVESTSPTDPLVRYLRKEARSILWGSLILTACFLTGALVLTVASNAGIIRAVAGLTWAVGLAIALIGCGESVRLQNRAKRIQNQRSALGGRR